jgi:signal transduction histidine kinase
MTLITRLSLFVLTALGLVLAGFCLTLYVAAHTYLYRHVDNGLESALNVLAAAAEIDSGWVEWEPQQRLLSLGTDTGSSPVQWVVTNDQGRRVDGFPREDSDTPLRNLPSGPPAEGPVFPAIDWRGQPWRLAERWVQSPRFAKSLAGTAPSHPEEIPRGKYAALLITAAWPLQPIRDTLATLGAALAGVSLGLLALAGVASRWFCRRALRPVTRMAASARQMGADSSHRLPCADTRDELADLGTAFNALLDRLHESFERQRRFTGDASHQLRTPLTGVLGQVEVALRQERSSEEYRHALRTVRTQVLQMRGIVEALLFLARGDAEANLSALERLDLAHWLGIHLESWRGHPRKEDIRTEIPSGGPLLVEAHSTLLGQLVDNLLDNACKYSAPGAPVTLRLWRDQASVFLTIEDEGAGIAREELVHVFQPFYRSPLARRAGTAGVGLGLAVANRIAAALGGELVVTSEPNRGSCFTLRLPVSSESPHSPERDAVRRKGAVTAQRPGGGTDQTLQKGLT